MCQGGMGFPGKPLRMLATRQDYSLSENNEEGNYGALCSYRFLH